MFDPNAALPDFATQKEQIDRQRVLAEMLRKQALSNAPQGQMVSGRYVAPSWLEHAMQIAKAGLSARMQGEIDKSQSAYNADVAAATKDWQSKLPQAIAATQGTAGAPAGFRDSAPNPEQGFVPAVEPQAGSPTKLASTGQILQHALAGMNIPGNEKAAQLYSQGALADQAREDTQAARKEDIVDKATARRENLVATLEARKAEFEAKFEAQKQAGLVTAEAKRQHDETLKAMAQMAADARRYAADQQLAGVRERTAASGTKQDKPLANLVHKELSDLDANATAIQTLKSDFKPEFAGIGGWAKDKLGPYIPGVSEEATNWWRNYRKQVELVQRHAMFGASLTGNEQKSWASADIQPGMKDSVIKANLETRAKLAEKVYEKVRTQRANEGHSVDAAFPSRGLWRPDTDFVGADGFAVREKK